MNDELPPMGDDVDAVLERAGRPRPPRDFEERVMARVAVTAAAGLATAAATSASASTTAASTVGGSTSAASLVSVKAAALGVGLFVAGTGAGVALQRTVLASPPPPPEVRVVTKEVRVEVPVEVRVEVPVPAPVPVRPAPRGPTSDRLLAEERALVEMGRSALSRGEAALALTHCQSHAKKFPSGQLAEERELLWVRSLMALGKQDEARARAAAFPRRFPGSLLAPSVAESVRSP